MVVSLLRFVDLLCLTSLLTNTTTAGALTQGVESLLRPLSALGLPGHEIALIASIALRFSAHPGRADGGHHSGAALTRGARRSWALGDCSQRPPRRSAHRALVGRRLSTRRRVGVGHARPLLSGRRRAHPSDPIGVCRGETGSPYSQGSLWSLWPSGCATCPFPDEETNHDTERSRGGHPPHHHRRPVVGPHTAA